jgi:hypothetical protein
MCSTLEGEPSQCFLGRDGIIGAFNFILLLGMVIATFQSFPPRHPVFQCWGASDVDRDDDGSQQDLSIKKEGTVNQGDQTNSDADDVELGAGASDNTSVSLFSSKRPVVPDIKSMLSWQGKENKTTKDVHEIDTDEDKSLDEVEKRNGDDENKPKPRNASSDQTEKINVKTTKNESVPENRNDETTVQSDTDSVMFLRSLAAVTKVGKEGRRVQTVERDHQVELTDEYPAPTHKLHNAPVDGAEVVKIRTEYYEGGSRTTKEVTHQDGSRTVTTTIESKVSGATSNASVAASKSTQKLNQISNEGADEVSIGVNTVPAIGSDDESVRKSSIPIAALRQTLAKKMAFPRKDP